MEKWLSWFRRDDDIEGGFEKKLIPPLSMIALVISFVGFFVNFLMRLNHLVTVVTGTAIIVYSLLYYYSKKAKYQVATKWILVIFSILLINLLWYYNNGSRGPALYMFVIIYSFFILVFTGKEKLVLSILASINVIVLFIVEYRSPNLVGHYYSDHDRIIDVYTALLYYGLVFYVFLTIIRNAYMDEYKKARTADKLKSAFLANMSHEIRTPLNAIVGFSNLLADGTIKEEERDQYISIINNSNDTLLQLIDDILDVSLIEAEQVKINEELFSVNEMMRNLEKTYFQILKEKKNRDIHLVLNIPQEIFLIKSDQVRINQVMVNLLNNAIKFTEKGDVEFGFTKEGDNLKFYVKDTGIGIKQENLEHLFNRFYKIEDDTRKVYRGTGIGLYLSKKIVEILGGSIHVHSDFGKGSVFYFFIPAKDLKIESPSSLHPVKHSSSELIRNPTEKKAILVIEDDLSSLAYFKKILTEMKFSVLEATSGKEGISLFRQHKKEIVLVLLDIRLPGISGFDVLKELRKERNDVSIIAQTAFAMEKDRLKCMKAGFDGYISKPVKKETLTNILNKFIRTGT